MNIFVMVFHKVCGVLGGALNRAKGMVKGQAPAVAAPRTLTTSTGVKTLQRSPVRDPEKWKRAFQVPTGNKPSERLTGPLLETVFLYGDLCEITYNNYVHNKEEQAAVQEQLKASGKEGARDASVLGGVWVGGFRYGPSELMSLPAGNRQKLPEESGKAKVPSDIPANQLNVTTDSPARTYTLGVPFDGTLEDDLAFYLFSTSGVTRERSVLGKDLQTTNWIGYVGIGPMTKCGRDIAVAFRGTQAWSEWLSDARGIFSMQSWSNQGELLVGGGGHTIPIDKIIAHDFGERNLTESTPQAVDQALVDLGDVQVGEGFEQMYRQFAATPGNTLSLQGQVQMAVRKLLARYGGEVASITTTGHSLGGALASLCAFDLVQSGINHQSDHPSGPLVPVTAFTFEAPRVGNQAFANAFDPEKWPMGPRCLRIVNAPDVVPKVPYSDDGVKGSGIPVKVAVDELKKFLHLVGPEASEAVGGPEAYVHGGTEYLVNDTDIVNLVKASDDAKLGPLKAWIHSLEYLEHISKDIGFYHDLQMVLRWMDEGSEAPTRGVTGPLGVAENVRSPAPQEPTASS